MVGIHQRDLDGGILHRLVPDVLTTAAVRHRLPENGLLRSVDRAIGVDQGRGGDAPFALVIGVKAIRIKREVFAPPGHQEILVALPVGVVESHPPIVTRSFPLDLAVTALIVETIERDVDTPVARPVAPERTVTSYEFPTCRLTSTRSERMKFSATI